MRYGGQILGVFLLEMHPCFLKQTTLIPHNYKFLNGKWIKGMKSKVKMYPDVRNTEAKHHILYWINGYIFDGN